MTQYQGAKARRARAECPEPPYSAGLQEKDYMNILINQTRQGLRRPTLLLALIITAIFLSACASNTPVAKSTDEIIVDRSQSRWAALLAGDFETAYSYYSPGYRSTRSVVDFAIDYKSRKVKWTSAEYKEHSCMENTCTVRFVAGFMVPKPVPGLDKYEGASPVEEKWVKTEGQWWYFDDKKVNSIR